MKHEQNLRIVRDMLLLVDSPVPLLVMREWSGWESAVVQNWAAAAHLKASDNSVRVPPVPRCVEAYARGKSAAARARLADFHAKAEKSNLR
jgi:hypothetical protein